MSQLNRNIAPAQNKITSSGFEPIEPLISSKDGEIYCIERKDYEVIEMQLWYPTGSYHQPKTSTALALNNLFLSGTENQTAEEIQLHLEQMGAQTFHQTFAFATCYGIRVLQKSALECLQFVQNTMLQACFPAKELANFKQVEIASKQREMQSPGFWSSKLLTESLYPAEHKMCRISTPETLESIDRSDILSFAENFKTNQFKAFLTGNISIELLEYFQSIVEPCSIKPLEASEKTWQHIGGQWITKELPNTTQVNLSKARLIPEQTEQDFHKYQLLNTILGGFFGSRLMQEIREEKGLTYGIGSYFSSGPGCLRWQISGELNKDNIEAANQSIEQIMVALCTNKIGEEELNRAKSYLSGQIRLGLDGPFGRMKQIISLQEKQFTQDYLKYSVNRIWETSADDLLQIADNFLHPASFNTVISGAI